MARQIDNANKAAKVVQQQIETTRRTYAPLETTDAQQRAAHDPGPITKTGRPSTEGPGKSGL